MRKRDLRRVAISDKRAYVRSSKDAAGAYLVFDAEEWRTFLSE